jgi:hypothetical protein
VDGERWRHQTLEIPISHYFDYAYDNELWDDASVLKWLKLWSAREFGADVATETRDIIHNYTRLAHRRVYEAMSPEAYSIVKYKEADRVLGSWKDVGKRVEVVSNTLPKEKQASFFEMVLHPVLAAELSTKSTSMRRLTPALQSKGAILQTQWPRKTLTLSTLTITS